MVLRRLCFLITNFIGKGAALDFSAKWWKNEKTRLFLFKAAMGSNLVQGAHAVDLDSSPLFLGNAWGVAGCPRWKG